MHNRPTLAGSMGSSAITYKWIAHSQSKHYATYRLYAIWGNREHHLVDLGIANVKCDGADLPSDGENILALIQSLRGRFIPTSHFEDFLLNGWGVTQYLQDKLACVRGMQI